MNYSVRWLLLPLVLALSTVARVHGQPHQISETSPESAKDLHGIFLALHQYAIDEGKLPNMENTATVKETLRGFYEDDSIFFNSQINQEYLPNPLLANKRVAKANASPDNLKADEVVVFYDPQPSADGKRWVLYAHQHKDGALFFTTKKSVFSDYLKQVDEQGWAKLKAASGM